MVLLTIEMVATGLLSGQEKANEDGIGDGSSSSSGELAKVVNMLEKLEDDLASMTAKKEQVSYE